MTLWRAGFRAVIAIFVVLGALAVLASSGLAGGWMKSLNPFAEETVDRTGPSVLKALNDLSDFRPASAYYETVVDLEDDVDNLPSWFSGGRVIYVGKGDVDAFVDFGDLDERRVVMSPDRTQATIRLPAVRIAKPALDLEKSAVAVHDEGFLTKFGGSDLERRAQLQAVKQMTAAANAEGMLVDRAQENTTTMLRGLLGSLGFTSVSVTFDDA